MSSIIAPDPLPALYSARGLDHVLRERFGSAVEWVVDHEVCLLTGPASAWSGFVHEFRVLTHPSVQRCYVIRALFGDEWQVHAYAKDDRVRNEEDAVRSMLADSPRRPS